MSLHYVWLKHSTEIHFLHKYTCICKHKLKSYKDTNALLVSLTNRYIFTATNNRPTKWARIKYYICDSIRQMNMLSPCKTFSNAYNSKDVRSMALVTFNLTMYGSCGALIRPSKINLVSCTSLPSLRGTPDSPRNLCVCSLELFWHESVSPLCTLPFGFSCTPEKWIEYAKMTLVVNLL